MAGECCDNVYLFIPNIIGYARVVLMFVGFYYMPTCYVTAGTCYLLSQLLDAFDGHAARAYNQCTKFGAVLDMVTDRVSTAGLLVCLSLFYPKMVFVFQFLIVLDISSHWIQVYSTLLRGETSHKKIDQSGNIVLRLYYTSRVVLFSMCAGNELFFAMLYLLHFTTGPIVGGGVGLFTIVAVLCLPVCVTKNLISVVQLVGGMQILADIDVKDRVAGRAKTE
jgi:CDP-diacylglycerol--inositol 3-phosphatidyltransferase